MNENAPSLFTTVRPDATSTLLDGETAQCGVILEPGGRFRLFSKNIDAEALKKPVDTLSEEQLDHLQMGQKLMALSLALSNEQVMDVLINLIADADVLDPERLLHVTRPN